MTGSNARAKSLGKGVRAARTRARRVAGRAKRAVLRRGKRPPGRERLRTIGLVEKFEYREIVGWVVGEAEVFPVRVTLHVNNLEVASTWADHPSDRNTLAQVRGFRFALTDLWTYCKRSHRVTVRIDGVPLPISAKGIYKRPSSDGAKSLDDLKRKFDENYLFSQTGVLQLSKKYDTEWQKSTLDLYDRVSDVLVRAYGYAPFVIYGTLLGLVREGGFIGHDIDFDAAYVSGHTDGASVAAELRDIAFVLIDAGFDVLCRSTALHVHDQSDPELRIDLFQLFFNKNGRLTFPFGVSTRTEFTTADWQGLEDAELSGHPVKVPANAEALVEHIYGPSWRTPIAGFQWARARIAFQEGELPDEYIEEVYWANFYAQQEFTDASTFAQLVLARDDIPDTVLDIGCGDGRDSLAFGRSGKRVYGLDRCAIAIRHASAGCEESGLSSRLSFTVGDVGDVAVVRDLVKQAREGAEGGAVLFYLRFFLHSITEPVQDQLMGVLAEASHDGDMFAAEFRTDNDKTTRKVYGKHYRRYQNGFELGKALREGYGFDVVHEEEGIDLAPYRDENPVLYRVLATRRARP